MLVNERQDQCWPGLGPGLRTRPGGSMRGEDQCCPDVENVAGYLVQSGSRYQITDLSHTDI
jgi:hypothetical protein